MTTLAHEAPGVVTEGAEERIPGFDVSFMSPEAMDLLRESQHAPVFEAGRQAVQAMSLEEISERGDVVRDEARSEAVKTSVDAYLAPKVPSAWYDEAPELRTRFADIVGRYSYHNMDEREWQVGRPNEDPEADDNSKRPGRERLQEELDALMVEFGHPTPDEDGDDDDDEPEPTPLPEVTPEQSARVIASRNRLAELSYQRRQLIRKGGRKARDLEEQYNQAKAEYDAAYKDLGVVSAQRLRAQGVENGPLRAAVVRGLLNEHQAFSDAELHVMENDGSARARIARWLARRHNLYIASAGSGLALGAASKFLIGGVLGLSVGIFAPAAIGAGAAIKSTKAVMAGTVGNRSNNIRRFDQRLGQDQQELEALLNEHTRSHSGDDTTLIHGAHDHVIGVIDRRVEKDRKSNRNRVIAAAAIGGAAGLAGELLETAFVDVDHLIFGGGGHAPSGPSPSPHPTGPGNPHPHNPGGTNPNKIDGFNPNVTVGNGEGYEQALTDLANQKGIHLSGPQSWALYEHLNNTFNGHFFTNNPSYHMDNPGEWGISHPGASHWSPAVIDEMNSWLNQHDLHAQAVKKVAKKAGKVVAGRTARSSLAMAA